MVTSRRSPFLCFSRDILLVLPCMIQQADAAEARGRRRSWDPRRASELPPLVSTEMPFIDVSQQKVSNVRDTGIYCMRTDGTLMYCGGNNGIVSVIHVDSREEVKRLQAHSSGRVFAVLVRASGLFGLFCFVFMRGSG